MPDEHVISERFNKLWFISTDGRNKPTGASVLKCSVRDSEVLRHVAQHVRAHHASRQGPAGRNKDRTGLLRGSEPLIKTYPDGKRSSRFIFLTGPVKNHSQTASFPGYSSNTHTMDKTQMAIMELSKETHFPGTRYSKSALSIYNLQYQLSFPAMPFRVK